MFKASMFLFSVHKSFKVKFSLIIDNGKPGTYGQTVNKFTFSGNDYLTITPYPFITIDVTSKMDKNEGWSSNQSFNMNRRELFSMLQSMKRLQSKFVTEKNLFYYEENNGEKILKVDTNISNQIREIFVSGNKRILLQPCVVENEEDHLNYEGIFLSINSLDYFSFLTYNDMNFLISEFEKIDMATLTLNLIEIVKNMEYVEFNQTEKKEPVVEKKESEIMDTKKRIRIEDPKEIPEI